MASPPSGTSLVGEMILLTESQAESSDSENSEATVFSSDPSETETRDTDLSDLMEYEDDYLDNDRSVPNIVSNLYNRELYGRFTKGPKFKTVRPFREIPERCRYAINDIFADSGGLFQILMGFTRCGRFFLTFEETHEVSLKTIYHLFIWRFIPGMKLELAQTIQIFNQFNGNYSLEQIMFMQYPNDYHKLVCVGIDKEAGQESLQISLVTLDGSLNCRHCSDPAPLPEELEHRGWCLKHGFAQHYFITLSLPAPIFDPLISLSYPGLLIIDSGHSIQILKVSTGPLGDDQGEFYSSTRAVSVTFDNPSDNQSVNSESLNEPETSAVEDISLDSCNNQNRLILLDSGQDHPKWIKKTVRRYTNGDYENGSLLSGDSRDDYNNPLELPLYIEDFDQPPEDFDGSAQHLNDRQVVHSQLTFDYEQFVDNLSRVLCERDQLFFRNSQDYNIKITKVCPIKEEIQCAVYIKIGACRTEEPFEMVQQYCADCTCIWNFITNEFKVPCCDSRLIPAEEYKHPDITIDAPNYSRSGILILNYRLGHRSKLSITDSQHNFEIYRNHITGDNDSSFWLS